MVDFSMTEEHRLLVRGLRAFIEREIRPWEEQYREYFADERKRLQDDGSLVPQVKEIIDRVRRRSGELGYYGMHMPEEVGGGGVNRVGLFLAQKEVWRHGLGLNAYLLAGPEGPSPMLLHLNEIQRKKYLYPLVKGEITTCFALTEPEAGSDLKNLKTIAEKQGDYYILNGLKTFITNAVYADFAQVFAVTDPKLYKESGYSGVTAFIVDRETPGYKVGRINRSILDDGSQAELIFENCKVPKENIIGEEQMGFYVAMSWIGVGRLNIAGMCVGLGEYLLKESVEYATQRTAFGKPIAKYQHIRGMLAESAAELFACEQLVLHCAWRLDQGEQIIKESAIAKYFATNMLYRLADRAVQIHGGMGVMKELPIERVFKLARVLRIVEGTDEIQKETIAKSLGL